MMAREKPEAYAAERGCARVRTRREGRREKDEIGAICAQHLAGIMRRSGAEHATRGRPPRPAIVRPTSAPGDGVAGRASEDEDEVAPAGDGADLFVAGAALFRREAVVAEHHAGAARQAMERGLQRGVGAFVGHQPDGGERLAAAHRASYRAAMDRFEARNAAQGGAAAERLAGIQATIAHTAKTAGRAAADVELIAISKTHPVAAIEPLIAAGQRSFGENRVQEAEGKWPALKAAHPDIRLHLVGQLQSNKAAAAVALFEAIHSVDRPSLIAALARAMTEQRRRPDCFAQVNIGAEAQKGGCAIPDLPGLLETARGAGLPIVGLMTVPPADTEAAPYFALLAKLAKAHGLARLSMGMSGDYETAVMLGATEVRVGTALFGGR